MIRDIRPEERELFLTLCHEFYHSPAVSHPVPDQNFDQTFTLAIEGSPYVRVLLLLADETPAGFAILSLTHSNEAGGLCVLIEDLMVKSEFFHFLEESYPHAARFRLEVMADNEGAIRLYERQGFVSITYRQMIKERSAPAEKEHH